jgi:isopentenyl-diphosphate delta-isomerase
MCIRCVCRKGGDAVLASRKADHLRICLEENVRPPGVRTGLERYRFAHQALPEIDLDDVDLACALFGKSLRAPLLVASMTGGTQAAQTINHRLAEAAAELGLGMGVGSQRTAIEDPRWAETYRVRDVAPDILLLANLGAVQLNRAYTVDHCRRAVDMIEADALVLHLNPLQEALQPGGDTCFGGLLNKIEAVCHSLPVPVVVKEVGNGLSPEVARQLAQAGVSALDVAGAGGTSWSEVERLRAPDVYHDRVAAQFVAWGIPTAESLRAIQACALGLPLIASGGIVTGVDVAKCIALGADLVSTALPLLRPALDSTQAVIDELAAILQGLRISMFCIGAPDLDSLQNTPHLQEIRA